MDRQHLRVFVATGTGAPFDRLLRAIRLVAGDASVELFVQRGAAGSSFRDLPGEDYVSRDAFERRLEWADVVILHGGAGSLYEAVVAGHTPVVLPRLKRHGEHVNDHQLELARELSRLGKVVCCESETEVPASVRRAPLRSSARPARSNALTEGVRAALLATSRDKRPPPIGSFVTGVVARLVHRVKAG